jgi:hypothetical protein
MTNCGSLMVENHIVIDTGPLILLAKIDALPVVAQLSKIDSPCRSLGRYTITGSIKITLVLLLSLFFAQQFIKHIAFRK